MTTIEVPARPATPDELVTVSVSEKTGRTTRRQRPAALLAERARKLGWEIRGPLYARGPITQGKRQEEPNADGKWPTIQATTVEDSFGLRLSDPSGRRLAALWHAGGVECRAWTQCTHPLGRCPRLDDESIACNMRAITLEELKALIDQGPRTEGEPAMDIEAEAEKAFDAIFTEDRAPGLGSIEEAFTTGYHEGVQAVTGHATVWVKTQRRRDQIRPGDVILGRDHRWWTVAASLDTRAGRWGIRATSGDETLTVENRASQLVDVIEEIALAAAVEAAGELGAERVA